MIVDLNGNPGCVARKAASRFLEHTNSAPSLVAAVGRKAKITARAAKFERERMRVKVAYTKRMRSEVIGVLDGWRDSVVTAVKGSHKREADAGQALGQELDTAVQDGALTPEQRDSMVERINAAIAGMDPAALASVILQIQTELINLGVQSGATEVGITWDIPPQGALDALSSQVLQFSNDAVQREASAIRQALSDGLTAGDGIPEMAQRIQDSFDDGVHILDDAGQVVRTIPSDSWAEMVARTETSRAMTAGLMRSYHAAGVKALQWVASEDERTCFQCGDLDGTVVLSGSEFDDGVTEPPAHVSCRCTVVAADMDEESD